MKACWLLIALLLGSCHRRHEDSVKTEPNNQELRRQTEQFLHQTSIGTTQGFETIALRSSYSPFIYLNASYWPSQQIVLPARTAAFLNQSGALPTGFQYASFTVSSSHCQGEDAFARYFHSIEVLRGSALSSTERSLIRQAFTIGFELDEVDASAACLLYDLISCIADYSIHNVAIFRQAVQSNDFTDFIKGGISCAFDVVDAEEDTGAGVNDGEQAFP